MKIIFADTNKAVADALSEQYKGLDFNVEVHNDDIFNYKADALVSPANSFGYMNGGIDLAYVKYFGFGLQLRVQGYINAIWWRIAYR